MVSRRNFLKSSILAAAPLAAHNAATQDIPEKPLPGTLTLADYHKAVAELRKAIGDRWVFTDDETELRTYRDVYSTTPDEAHMPAAAVAPRTVEEIQAILRIARDYRIPLWTISTGKNYAYGGAGADETRLFRPRFEPHETHYRSE